MVLNIFAISHWFYEMKKFCSLQVLEFSGVAAVRKGLRKVIEGTPLDVIIISYDVLRNDIEYFQGLHFNYCVLDEGHIIKVFFF